MAATYVHQGSGSQSAASGGGYVTSLTPPLPSGTTGGDVLVLWAKGAHNSAFQHWAPSTSGWVELGDAIDLLDGSGTGQQYNSCQAWIKRAGASETDPTVTLTTSAGSGITRSWQTGIDSYRAVSGTPQYGIVLACQDGTAAAGDYTPASPTISRDSTVVTLVLATGTGGTITVSPDQGFTSRRTLTNAPAGRLMDKNVTAGTITMPTFPSGIRPWMSKTFAFDRAADEWGVDTIQF